jgi:hypothetical protein
MKPEVQSLGFLATDQGIKPYLIRSKPSYRWHHLTTLKNSRYFCGRLVNINAL